MPRHASTTTPMRARVAPRALRLRRTFRVQAEVTTPAVAHLVADDEVECASTVASSLAWRRRYGLGEP